MSLPKVLIGGWPGSGTSFLTNLIVEMGFSPGSSENLKKADKYNRWGYFEHLPIRKLCWKVLKERERGTMREYSAGGYFDAPVVRNLRHPAIAQIAEIAAADNVEVYKITALPLLYWLFPSDSKYIIIDRNVEETFHRRAKRAKWETFKENYFMYMRLVEQMYSHVDTFMVQYNDFRKDFGAMAMRVASFCFDGWINAQHINIARLRDIFRPGAE